MGRYSGKTCRLLTMLSLTASFFVVEIVVGYLTNSIALVADSFHMLSDVAALIVGFASVRISKWQTEKNTYGWVRAEVVGAMANALFLVALCFSILVEALKRLVTFEEVENPKLLLIVGGMGLLVNFIGLALFHNHGHSHGGHSHGGHSHGGHSHGGGGATDHNHSQGHGHSHSHGHNHRHGDGDHHGNEEEKKALVKHTSANGVIKPVASEISQDEEAGDDESVKIIINDTSKEELNNIDIDIDNPRVAASAQLNMRGVFLHVLGDALGSVIVVISALVIWFAEGDWRFYVDPAMRVTYISYNLSFIACITFSSSMVMVMIIFSTTLPLLKESGFILLQTVPSHIHVSEIKEKVEKIDGVLAVHELHIWQLAGNRIIGSAHIRCKNLQCYMKTAREIRDLFHHEGIHSTTIQPEFTAVRIHTL
ncbi:hypothetical protein FSP39_002634 [Pinctada imbricata]|uniref:Zinc transporter 1 n=1 Tax=Pinctada imbricata TaxID=66713 RepID=A0AA88Y6F2_PINIB|nr:hypothetical protein FSP39_002634 [Pinctada imbricata]